MLKWILTICLVYCSVLSAETKVLALAGSTREDSANKKLVREAALLAQQMGANVTLIDLRDFPIPLYDGDLEKGQGMPANAKKIRNMMIESDVIFIASPDYNGSLTAVLKNVLDWASRSEKGGSSRDAYKGKKFAIMSASPGWKGGVRGLAHLRTVLEFIGGTVIPQQVVIPHAFEEFDDKGHLKNDEIRIELQKLVQTAIN